MSSIQRYFIAVVSLMAGTLASGAMAQGVLEEIVVTAQRREQSIQEVPVSLEAFSGDLLNQAGLRTMEDLSNFSPSVEIDVQTQQQDVSIRGMGTTGTNLSLEQAAPIFVDGVHFGRTSMIQGAFLDLERVEVLRGPQPIAFGQNATAGAFSMTTKKPTPQWEGDVTAEYGNFGRASIEGGVGGPITDTLGIRVAGQWDKLTGFIRDIVSREMFPNTKEYAARVTLQWTPSENFETTLKAEYMGWRKGGDGNVVCRIDGDVPLTERAVTITGLTAFDDVIPIMELPRGCENGFERLGVREGSENSFKPVPGITQEDTRAGIVDLSTVVYKIIDEPAAHDDVNAYNYRLGMTYSFDNDISFDSNTAYVDYSRSSVFDNSSSPILTNLQHRGEVFDMFSQEFRFLSPRGGAIEWEAGAYYQQEDLDLGNPGNTRYQSISIRGNLRSPVRLADSWQDTKWKSIFGSFTYNFPGDQISIDAGARYTRIDKQSYIRGYASTLIYDIDPDPDNDNNIPSTETDLFTGAVVQTRNVNNSIIDCASGHFSCGTYGAGFWTHVWNLQDMPNVWMTESPVDTGPRVSALRPDTGPFFRDYEDTSLDPQVTLRYRPTDDLSLYGKWARAFKGGGAEIATGTLPSSEAAFPLEAEHAQAFEIGAKGSLWDSSLRYNVSLFTLTIKDLQVSTVNPSALDSGGSSTSNAGKQRTRGLEFDAIWAATEHLTLGLSGALMDGKMLEYEGAGCTDIEFEQAETGPCRTLEESAEILGLDVDDDDADLLEGTIDRSGFDAPRTPDWKFVVDVDYWRPVFDNYKLLFSANTSLIDGYVNDIEGFSETVKYDQRIVTNLNMGIADIGDSWDLRFWVRNLFNEGIKYFPEFDVDPEGRVDYGTALRNYRTYGLQLKYNFN